MADWTPAVGAAKTPPPNSKSSGAGWTPAQGAAPNLPMFKSPSSRYQIDPDLPTDVPDEGGEGFLTDTGKGVAAMGFSSLLHGGDMVRRVFGLPRVIDTPEAQKLMTPPDTTYGKLGAAGEQFAEGFIPVPGTGALKAWGAGKGIIKRALAYGTKDAIQAGVTSGIQSGADPATTIGSAALGGTVGALTGGVGAAWDRTAKLTRDVDPTRLETANWGRAHGVTVDPSTRTGNSMVAGTKKGLEHGINSGKAEDLANLQSHEYALAGDDLIEKIGGGTMGKAGVPNRAMAGKASYEELANVAEGYRQEGNKHFGGFRAQEKMFSPQQHSYTTTEMVDTGTVSQMTGRPVMAPRQVTKQGYFKIPVDRTQLQKDLRALASSLGGTMDPTEQSQNPALNIIKKIVNGDSMVDASKAIQDLQMIDATFRLQPGQLSRDIKQFIGSGAYQQYRGVVDQAIKNANPALLDLVNAGRAAVGNQHAVQGLMQDVAGRVKGETVYRPTSLKPVKVYNSLVMEGDMNLPMLQHFAQRAPGEVRNVAATYMKSLLDIGSEFDVAKHSFTKAQTVLSKWQRLGPETKNILFGPELTRDLDNFFRLGKYLSQNPNTSGTGAQVWLAARFTQLLTHPTALFKGLAMEQALGKYVFSDRGPLPYIKEISPGVFGVNPLAVGAGSAFRQITGTDPVRFHENRQAPPKQGTN